MYLGAFALLVLGLYLSGRLDAAEFTSGYAFDSNGDLVQAEPEPNPDYLQGTEREVFQFLLDVTPGGQTVQYSAVDAHNPQWMPVYSLIIVLVSTAIGAALFRRKDLK